MLQFHEGVLGGLWWGWVVVVGVPDSLSSPTTAALLIISRDLLSHFVLLVFL